MLHGPGPLLTACTQGPSPSVVIYSAADMQQLGSLNLGFELGYAALAFSADGERIAICGEDPDTKVVVFAWRQGEQLVSGQLPVGTGSATQVSFHPYDGDRLLTTCHGKATLAWRIERLWDKFSFKHTEVVVHDESGAPEPPSCHCWYPGGLYVGTSTGRLHALNASTYKPIHASYKPIPQPAPADAAPAAEEGAEGQQGLGPAEGAAGGQAVPDLLSPPPRSVSPNLTEGGRPGSQGGWAVRLDVFSHMGGPVTCLSVSRDLVAVGGQGAVHWYSHAKQGAPAPALYCQSDLGPASTALGCDMGGNNHASTALGMSDGRVAVLMVEPMPPGWGLPPEASSSAARPDSPPLPDAYGAYGGLSSPKRRPPSAPKPQVAPPLAPAPSLHVLTQSHVGQVAGMVPAPWGQGLLSCGADGSLRVWSAGSGEVLASRTFSSALTGLAVTAGGRQQGAAPPLAAVGSETGVLRLVALPEPGESESEPFELKVTWRRRLHTGPLHSLAFSPDGSMLVTAGRDNSLWFLSIHRDGTAQVHGQVRVKGGCAGPLAAWRAEELAWQHTTRAFLHVSCRWCNSCCTALHSSNPCTLAATCHGPWPCCSLQVVCPEPVLCVVWPEVHDVEDVALASLASGGVMAVSAPVELAAASRQAAAPDMVLNSKEALIKVGHVVEGLENAGNGFVQ